MSKSYRYPPDEFDDVPEDAPTGVHRVPRSPWRKVVPFVVVAVVFAVVAYGAVTIASNLLGSDGASATDKTTSASKDSTKSTPKATTKPKPTKSADASGSDDTSGADDTSSADVDHATAVAVKNGAGITGLAAKAATTLEGDGFTKVTPGDYTGTKLADSVVYYVDSKDEATAKAVGSSLGISDVEQVSALKGGAPIIAVLVHDLS
ncbi:LytR C-terminal domain-containing protein [Luteimicrobium sp. NPDC057192]|uniref:LytR C-terminal domain-containing protein n=1 Tax=Luteimicrobium sp. NPDC057192 TaxID=3346042 RepID=UPI00364102A8